MGGWKNGEKKEEKRKEEKEEGKRREERRYYLQGSGFLKRANPLPVCSTFLQFDGREREREREGERGGKAEMPAGQMISREVHKTRQVQVTPSLIRFCLSQAKQGQTLLTRDRN
uniref:Uncharacterized protein n=1 Tax=Micrurus corallinus TaxID=54390 RepID=A0A2D4G751_MICCO